MKVSFKSSTLACALALVCGVISFSANTLAQDRKKLADAVEPTLEYTQAEFEAWQAAAAPKIAARTEIISRILSSVSADAARLNPNSPSETLRGIGQMLHLADMETLQQAANLTGLQDVEKLLVLASRHDAALPVSKFRSKAALGDGINLVFTAITPCRIADSRTSTAGILLAGVSRNYLNFSATGQGGDVGCNNSGSPGIASGTTGALALTFTVTQTSTAGFLQVAPISSSFTTSVVNWTGANETIANSTVLQTSGGGGDFKVVSGGGSNTHVIIDLLGFYLPSQPAALTCTNVAGASTAVAANQRDLFIAGGACAAGTTVVTSFFQTPSADLVLADSTPPNCRVTNLSAIATTAICIVKCCSVPGTSVGRF